MKISNLFFLGHGPDGEIGAVSPIAVDPSSEAPVANPDAVL